MFRKLYWVTEYVHTDGSSNIAGVYTSIPDLVRHGLRPAQDASLRLTLTKLDSEGAPLGTWMAPDFQGLAEALEPYIKTEEFTADQCASLVQAMRQPNTSVAA